MLKIDRSMTRRYLNDGFSGGEKKRVEILQMAMLKPEVAILDETDSGLDIDALRIVAEGVNTLAGPEMGVLVITHYQRLLNYIRPDDRPRSGRRADRPLRRPRAGRRARARRLRRHHGVEEAAAVPMAKTELTPEEPKRSRSATTSTASTTTWTYVFQTQRGLNAEIVERDLRA